MLDRSILFIDGNNWYHSLKSVGVRNLRMLDYSKIAEKIVGPRDWVGSRYYVGQVRQEGNAALHAAQRNFVAMLEASDSRVSVHFGRLEYRPVQDSAAKELRQFLASSPTRLDPRVYRALSDLATRHSNQSIVVEKAVDVMLAVDLVVMAERNQFDTAYLLSADGDYTPAVEVVKRHGKKVYAVSAGPGAQLAAVVDSFIRVARSWFDDCY